MKLVHLSIYPPKDQSHAYVGGVAPYTKNLVTNLPSRESDQVFVLCNKIDGKCERYTESAVQVVRCFDKDIRFIWQITQEIRRVRPHVIHVQQELALYGGILTAYFLQWLLFLLRKYQLVITLHGVVSLKKIDKKFVKENNSKLPVWIVKLGFFLIYRPLCIWTQKVIVHEDYFKEILVAEYGVKKEKITVIHLGIEDLKAIDKKKACQRLGLDVKKNIILYVGYLTGYKGIDLLLDGFAEYVKIDQNAFLIVGAGKHPKFKDDKKYLIEYKRLQDKAKKLIDKSQYWWVGFIEEQNIADYYSASDISVYPYTISMSSSGPMAFAIGYEKPFLASDAFDKVINNPEMIFQRTPNHLAQKLRVFFQNKKKFQSSIKRMKKERLWTKISKETYGLYL